MSSALLVLLAAASGTSAGCFNPEAVTLDPLDPEASHFGWVVQDLGGQLLRGRLLVRTEESPALVGDGEQLLVFPVYRDDFVRAGLDPDEVPANSALLPADVCDPQLQPQQYFRAEEGRLSPSDNPKLQITAEFLWRCPDPAPPLFNVHGDRGRGCVPELSSQGACAWDVGLGAGCNLSEDRLAWRLRSYADGGACALPLNSQGCKPPSEIGGLLSVTTCADNEERVVLTRPTVRLDVRTRALPGHAAPGYGQGDPRPRTGDELDLRVGFLPGFIQLEGGDLMLAVSSTLSSRYEWQEGATTTLHRLDPESLETLASSPALPLYSVGMVHDGRSTDSALLVVQEDSGLRLRLVRVNLEGEELQSRTVATATPTANGPAELRFVDLLHVPELDALVSVVIQLDRSPSPRLERWLEVLVLDPVTLEVRKRSDPEQLAGRTLGSQAFMVGSAGALRLAVVDDEDDRLMLISLGLEDGSPIRIVYSELVAVGGGATVQHVTEHLTADSVVHRIASLSNRQRSWRKVPVASDTQQYASNGLPTLTAPLGPDLLLAPELDPATGDLQLMLLEPRHVDLMPALAPVLRAVGPAGIELHHRPGTVWFTLPWTGQLARVDRSPD